MGRTTPITSHTLCPKQYARRPSSARSSPQPPPHVPVGGVTGPHVGRLYKISPSSSPPLPSLPPATRDHRSSDFSKHRGSFMAEVLPAERHGAGSFGRMLSIRLHVTEEAPVTGEAGEVTTHFKRWVSTDTLHVQRCGTAESADTRLPRSSNNMLTPELANGIARNNSRKSGAIDVNTTDISESGSVLNKRSEKRAGKKRWKIKRIFGIKI